MTPAQDPAEDFMSTPPLQASLQGSILGPGLSQSLS